MFIPKINSSIDTKQALELCKHFNFDYLVRRIKYNPDKYKSWKFDGCSGLPDKILGFLTGCDWKDITYRCCLPHDLCYGYGELGSKAERKKVDKQFYQNLVTKAYMKKWCAYIFYIFVRVGGAEMFGLSFSWGFANKKY